MKRPLELGRKPKPRDSAANADLLAEFEHAKAPSFDPILPGSILGVLGGGQLGRMFAIAARELGYRIYVYAPESDSPAGQIGDREFSFPYEDLDRVREFARQVQVVTFEFENVPVASTAAAAEFTSVRPDGWVLHITQNRLREKSFLHEHGFPVTPFRAIGSESDLKAAVKDLGLPGILKTAAFGYDGKGQLKVVEAAQTKSAWETLEGREGIYESFVGFQKELSVIVARTVHGGMQIFPVFENSHLDRILDLTFAPADVPPKLHEQAVDLASNITEKLEVVGLLTVEMFVTPKGQLLVNELAPRPHNSGHLTIDACVTSQFEQQVRAVCSLPLGRTELREPAAMGNLLGQLWGNGEPDWAAALEDPWVKLHLYGKAEPRPGRKMGHITATGATAKEALARVVQARNRL